MTTVPVAPKDPKGAVMYILHAHVHRKSLIIIYPIAVSVILIGINQNGSHHKNQSITNHINQSQLIVKEISESRY